MKKLFSILLMALLMSVSLGLPVTAQDGLIITDWVRLAAHGATPMVSITLARWLAIAIPSRGRHMPSCGRLVT